MPHLSYDKAKNRLVMRIFDRDSARELVLPPLEVRASDPRTGEAMPSAAAVPQDVRPEKLDFKVGDQWTNCIEVHGPLIDRGVAVCGLVCAGQVRSVDRVERRAAWCHLHL